MLIHTLSISHPTGLKARVFLSMDDNSKEALRCMGKDTDADREIEDAGAAA